jgi:hypothetical protein
MTSNASKQLTNGVTQRALSIGLQQSPTEVINEDEYVLKMTHEQKKQAESLCDFLGVSWGTTLNIAIKSALAYAKKQELDISEFREFPNQIGSEPVKVILDTKALIRLEEAGMSEKVNECLITGIHILYDKLIPNTSINNNATNH